LLYPGKPQTDLTPCRFLTGQELQFFEKKFDEKTGLFYKKARSGSGAYYKQGVTLHPFCNKPVESMKSRMSSFSYRKNDV
jgi:hypothetical protein